LTSDLTNGLVEEPRESAAFSPGRNHQMKKSLFASGMIVVAGTAMAQTAHPGAVGQHMMPNMVPADAQLKWTPSTVLPKGAEGAVLIGDPTKSGEVIIVRSKFPPNYQAPAHTHPFTETITVISGSVGFGEDKIDKAIPMAKAGAVFLNPAGHAHTIWTGDEPAIIQVQYIGPGGIDFVNPADDPRKK
jgi:quercetin dioxygenase-like cupin family protein